MTYLALLKLYHYFIGLWEVAVTYKGKLIIEIKAALDQSASYIV